jgi:hypothetical protein
MERHRRGRPAHDVQAGTGHERVQRAPREEAQVRAVEDAAVGVVEAARQQRQPDPQVGDVGHRDDDVAAGREEGDQPGQHARGVREVLEHVAADDDVEVGVERRHAAIQVGHDQPLAMGGPGLGQDRVGLDGRDLPALGRETTAQQPVGRPHVEQPAAAAGGEPAENHRVAAVRIRLERVPPSFHPPMIRRAGADRQDSRQPTLTTASAGNRASSSPNAWSR